MTPAASPDIRDATNLAVVIAAAVNLDAATATAVANAHRLLAHALRADEAGGVRCLPMRSAEADGLCVGSGHRVAAAHGLDAGVAVFVAADKIAERTVQAVAMQIAERMKAAGLDAGRWRERAAALAAPEIDRAVGWSILAVAAHEAAHAVALPPDATAPTDHEADKLRAIACNYVATADHAFTVRHHGPAWAAAYAVIVSRLVGSDPDCRTGLDARMKLDARLAGGIDFDTVAAVVADVPHDAPIRPLLADADFMAHVEAVMPTADERLAKLTAADGPQRDMDSENSCGIAARKFG